MVFDLDMIKRKYDEMTERISHARRKTGRALSLTEKILYSHLDEGKLDSQYERGEDYVYFRYMNVINDS